MGSIPVIATMTIREYKKRYRICEDVEGKTIYAGDTVELYNGVEMRSSWTSLVYWNMVDGAYVDSHPGHVKNGTRQLQRSQRIS